MNATPGSAVAPRPPRWVLAGLILALAAAVALAACGNDERRVHPNALDGALSHLRSDSSAAFAVVTDLESAGGPSEKLSPDGRDAVEAVVRSQLGQPGLPFDAVIRPQLGNALVIGITRRGEVVRVIRARNPAKLRRDVEGHLDRGVERLDSYREALVWKDRRAGRAARYAALDNRELLVARSERDLQEAIDAAHGSENLVSNGALRAKLRDAGLMGGVGDVQRLLASGDAQQAEDARRVRWVRSLGIFDLHIDARARGLFVEFALDTDLLDLSERDLPLEPGAASPRLHDPGAAASVAVREPQRLIRFFERSLRVTDPARFERYQTGVEQLRAILRVDLRRDLIDKITSLSLAAETATAFTFVGTLASGSEAGFRRDLERAQLFVQGVVGDVLPDTRVTARGTGPQRVWVVRSGGVTVARYAVRGGALVGAVGSGSLPRPRSGTRPRGVTGSLVVKGDVGRIGRLLDFLLEVPAEAFGVVSRLGDLTLGVRTDTRQLRGSGRVRVRRTR